MPIEYSDAASVRQWADKLIKDHHPHLTNVKIEYVFRSEAATKDGKPVWGRARLVQGLNAYLATPPPATLGAPGAVFLPGDCARHLEPSD